MLNSCRIYDNVLSVLGLFVHIYSIDYGRPALLLFSPQAQAKRHQHSGRNTKKKIKSRKKTFFFLHGMEIDAGAFPKY